MQNDTKISCPNCGTLIDVQDILAHQLEDQIKKEYHEKLSKERQESKSKLEQLQKVPQFLIFVI